MFALLVVVCLTTLTNCFKLINDVEQDDAWLTLLDTQRPQPHETPDGDRIREGDIVEAREVGGRKAVAEPVLYWPGAVVPFSYHYSVSGDDRQVIERAMKHWERETCVTFRARESLDYMWIRFRTDSPGCWSLVGRQFLRFGVGQDVSIGQGCAQMHVVAHEIGHALGFFHEQSRSDRDSAIAVIWDNVQDGYDTQFRKEEDANFSVAYDYTSVMQYPSWAFSKDVLAKNTIVTLDPRHQRFLGRNTDGLSFRDKKAANALYACAADCPDASSAECLNDGYLRPYRNDGRPCGCECPPTATGAACETRLNDDYYEALSPTLCGGNVTEDGAVLETPNYPRRVRAGESCVWDVRAPSADQLVQLDFEGFEFAPRNVKPGSKTDGKCLHESVEIRLDDAFEGRIFCGADIAPNTRMVSTLSRVVVIVLADERMRGSGLRARVTFVDAPTTTTTEAPTTTAAPAIWRRIIVNPWRRRQTTTAPPPPPTTRRTVWG